MKHLITTLTLLITSLSYSQEYTYGRMVMKENNKTLSEELKTGQIEIMPEEGWIYITFPGYTVDQWQMKIVKEEKKVNGDLFYVCLASDKSQVFMLYYKETNEFVLKLNENSGIVFQRIKKS